VDHRPRRAIRRLRPVAPANTSRAAAAARRGIRAVLRSCGDGQLRCIVPPEVAADGLRRRSGNSDADPRSHPLCEPTPIHGLRRRRLTRGSRSTSRSARYGPKPARRPWLSPRPQLERD
jgi:hypothetical protein